MRSSARGLNSPRLRDLFVTLYLCGTRALVSCLAHPQFCGGFRRHLPALDMGRSLFWIPCFREEDVRWPIELQYLVASQDQLSDVFDFHLLTWQSCSCGSGWRLLSPFGETEYLQKKMERRECARDHRYYWFNIYEWLLLAPDSDLCI